MPKSPNLRKTNKQIANEGLSLPTHFLVVEGTSTSQENNNADSVADSVNEVTLYPLKENVLESIINKLKNIELNNNTDNLNSNPNNNNNNTEMATTITTMDLIKIMTPFDGTSGTLNRFIRNGDRVIATANNNEDLVTDLLRTKITGKANEMLISVGDPNDWSTIKNHLQTQFSDRRTLETILHKLNTISQGNKPLELYYAEISDLQTALLNSVDTTKSVEFRAGQNEVYLDIVLKSFIAGLDSQLGYIVRANKPTNIKEAYDICLN